MGGHVFVDITMSLDGFITGPNDAWMRRSARVATGSTGGCTTWRASAGPTDRRAAGRGPTTTS
jgi:hypothetical protein